MDFTDYLAIYASVLSTAIFAFEIYRWRSQRPLLRAAITTGRDIIDSNSDAILIKNVIIAEITNTGGVATTIKRLGYCIKDTKGKTVESKLSKNPSMSKEIPYLIEPGASWDGFLPSSIELDNAIADKRVYLTVDVSHAEEPLEFQIFATHQVK